MVFDLGMVLAPGTEVYRAPSSMLGVSQQDYHREYWRERRAYDDGGTASGYWAPLLERLGVKPWDGLIDRLATMDARAWTPLRPTARDLMADCRKAGRQVVVLSNAPLAMVDTIEEADWRPLADLVFVSAVLGASKPDPRIYSWVQDGLTVDRSSVAFIDDKQPNVDGARAFGWHAHLWRDDSDSRDWLSEIGALR